MDATSTPLAIVVIILALIGALDAFGVGKPWSIAGRLGGSWAPVVFVAELLFLAGAGVIWWLHLALEASSVERASLAKCLVAGVLALAACAAIAIINLRSPGPAESPTSAGPSFVGPRRWLLPAFIVLTGLLPLVFVWIDAAWPRPPVTLVIALFRPNSDNQHFGDDVTCAIQYKLKLRNDLKIVALPQPLTNQLDVDRTLNENYGDLIVFGELQTDQSSIHFKPRGGRESAHLGTPFTPSDATDKSQFFARRFLIDIQVPLAYAYAEKGYFDTAVGILNGLQSFPADPCSPGPLNGDPDKERQRTSDLQLAARETAYAGLLYICSPPGSPPCAAPVPAPAAAERRDRELAAIRRLGTDADSPVLAFDAQFRWRGHPDELSSGLQEAQDAVRKAPGYGRPHFALALLLAFSNKPDDSQRACAEYAAFLSWWGDLQALPEERGWLPIVDDGSAKAAQDNREKLSCAT